MERVLSALRKNGCGDLAYAVVVGVLGGLILRATDPNRFAQAFGTQGDEELKKFLVPDPNEEINKFLAG